MLDSAILAIKRRSEEHTSELQSRRDLVCRLLLEKKKSNEQFEPRRPQRAVPGPHAVYRRHAAVLAHPWHVVIQPLIIIPSFFGIVVFFFKDTAPTEIYPLSLHDALPISVDTTEVRATFHAPVPRPFDVEIDVAVEDRKSTRLNSSHRCISYAVFCLN